MTSNQFKEAFKRGLGSAYIELKNSNDLEQYKDIILWCSTHITSYDMQSEGSRGEYIYEAIKLYEAPGYFEEEIIKSFEKNKMKVWSFDQLCELLFKFAVDGSKNARDALYKKYDALLTKIRKASKGNADFSSIDAFEEICVWLSSLDGFKAYKMIVEDTCEIIIDDISLTASMNWFHSTSKSKFGNKKINNCLQKVAVTNEYMARFLLEEENNEEKPIERNAPLEVPTADEYLTACSEKASFGARRYAFRIAHFGSEQLHIEIANKAIEEKDPKIKHELLWVFRACKFPLDEKHIFELTKSEYEEIRDVAFEILENMKSTDARNYAITLLKENKEVINSVSLLAHNFKKVDEAILSRSLRRIKVSYNSGGWHGAYRSVEKLLQKNNKDLKADMFIHMYKNTLCSYCRCNLVQAMYKRNLLPLDILQECRYDSYDETREFAEKILNKSLI